MPLLLLIATLVRRGDMDKAPTPMPAEVASRGHGDEELRRIGRTWHALSSRQAIDTLATRTSGLTTAEADERRQRFGANELPSTPPRSLVRRFLDQLNNMLIYVLLGAAVITMLLGHLTDTAVILGVVVINAMFGVAQEGKAARAMDAIRAMISPNASVVRDGSRTTIPASGLVPGDILLLDAGDRVTADARLVSARGLRIDEAALTGESVPADKRAEADAPDTVLAERASMVYSGTLVTQGTATAVVVATGRRSEIGRITTMLDEIAATQTPLTRQMNDFARQLSVAITVISLAMLGFAIFVRGYPAADAFLAVVGIAVAAIPEGLPAVMTITLAIGVERMSHRNAIIRHLPAVETLGSVSIICTDKTGTLTRNEMMARHVVTAAATYEADGRGYQPDGTLTASDGEATRIPAADAALGALIRTAALCNDARLAHDGNSAWRVEGDPMEGALLTLAHRAGAPVDDLILTSSRRDLIPFDAAHRFMATLNADAAVGAMLHVKGAPEEVLGLCSGQVVADGTQAALDIAFWHSAIARLAAEGERTLAFAVKQMPHGAHAISHDDLRDGLLFVGIVGLIDPPREEVRDAIAQAHSAGITVKMITGDHAMTAAAIARQLGIADKCGIASGSDVEALDAAALAATAARADIFARTAPEHKLRLVEALRSNGQIVAMTGDGVNDAPALKSADVGIAMGRKGTEAAKEASKMVLADDNFASIVAAVKEGRTVYDNLTKVISWTLPTNFGEGFVVMAAILGGMTLPVTPVQILWINMVTAVTLGLVLAFEPAEADVMRRPPRAPGQSLLTPLLAWQVVLVSSLFALSAAGMFWWARHRGIGIEEARTIVVNTIVVQEIFYLFAIRFLRSGSLTLEGIKGTPAVLIGVGAIVILQLAFTYLPIMQTLFGTRPVAMADGMAIMATGIVLLAVLEMEKRMRQRLWPDVNTTRP